MTLIKSGDKVRHKKILLNGGLAMNVIDVENNQALCEYFEGVEQVHKQTWFDTNDLEVVIYGDVGFRNEGE